VEHLEETMKEYWRQIKGSKADKDCNKEMQLSGFGGLCYHCKQTGHKAHDCPKKTLNGNGKSNGKGQTGIRERQQAKSELLPLMRARP
jgi:hypothetical protein